MKMPCASCAIYKTYNKCAIGGPNLDEDGYCIEFRRELSICPRCNRPMLPKIVTEEEVMCEKCYITCGGAK